VNAPESPWLTFMVEGETEIEKSDWAEDDDTLSWKVAVW
jgi:hypothetical protein